MTPRALALFRSRGAVVAVAVSTLAAGLAAVVSIPTAQAAPAAHVTPAATQYVKAVPLCGRVKSNHMTCDAMRLVRTTKGAAGARAMTVDRPDSLTPGAIGGYSPAEIATAYGANPATATTMTVAIVDAYGDPTIRTDLAVFDAHYGLPVETGTSFRVVNQTGTTTQPSLPAGQEGWAGEQALDVQAVRGLCHLCKIILVEASTTANTDLAIAENEAVTLGAKIVSNSWGGAETPGVAPSASYVAAFNHPGVAILASTGDHGWYDWDYLNQQTGTSDDFSSNAPSLPASLPTTVAVGGTSLALTDTGARAGETVWNNNGPNDDLGFILKTPMGASGGGCSTVYTAASWQSHASGYPATGCGTKRMVGDIAAVADPFTGFDTYNTTVQSGVSPGWVTVGGTSLATPVVAALWALAGGPAGVTVPSLTLYGHYKSDTTKSFYDVTVGANGACGTSPEPNCDVAFGGSPNTLGAGLEDCYWVGESETVTANDSQCHAKPGFDGPSGIGTPSSLSLFRALTPTARITSPGTVTHGVTKTFSASSSTDPFPNGSISTYAWTWGDGSPLTSGRTPTHRYAKAGKYTLHLYVKDNFGRQSPTVALTITVK